MQESGSKPGHGRSAAQQYEDRDSLAAMGPAASVWARVRGQLRKDVGDAAFKSWLKPVSLHSVEDGVVRLTVPTRFLRDWLVQHYLPTIETLWRKEDGALCEVEVLTEEAPCGPDAAAAAVVPAEPSKAKSGRRNGAAAAAADAISVPLLPKFTFDSFVVGKPNELAHAAARRVAEADTVPFNPLVLYGGTGLGKTHLLHAIGWRLRERDPDRRLVYMTAETFMYQFIRAVRQRDTMAFKEQLRAVDVLMVDDIQFIAGKDSTQEEFFHTFNALMDQNKQVVLTSDKSPTELMGIEERLRSRLTWGLTADIHPTTYELRLSILTAKAEAMGLDIPARVLEFVAHKVAANVRELEGALQRIAAHQALVGRDVTLELVQECLHDILKANDRRITIEEIQRKVADHYNIRLADMHTARRAISVARPRQVAMYLCKHLTTRSLPEIGRKFGGRDHTTVMHAIKRIDELRMVDGQLDEDVDMLRRTLET